jgi:O-antigen ligase
MKQNNSVPENMAVGNRITTNNLSLDTLKFIGSIVMVVSLPFSESLKSISLGLIFLAFLIQWFRKEIKIDFSTIHYGFILLFISSVISSAFALNTAKSLKGANDILFYSSVFFVASSISSEKHIRIILWSLYISTTLSALSGIYHSIEINKPLEIHSLGNQNYTAMFFVIVTTSMLSTLAFSDKESRFMKFMLIISSAIILIASVMTVMRASFLGLFIFLAVLLFSKERPRTALLISLGCIGLTALALYIDKSMWLKFLSSQSLISRLDIWKHAIRSLIENPIIGIGLNHFSYTFPLTHSVEPGNTVYDAHNLYLQVASQMGSIGVLALTIIIVGFIYRWINFKPATGVGIALKYSAMGAFLIVTVTGLFDTTLHHEHAIAFTLMTGLLFSYGNRIDNAKCRKDGI